MRFKFTSEISAYRKNGYYCRDLIKDELKVFSMVTYFDRDLSQPRKQGGSCPLAYALKELDGLKLTDIQQGNFWEHTAEKMSAIIELNHYHKLPKPDFIIPIPSSKEVVLDFIDCIYWALCVKDDEPILSIFKKISDIKSVPVNERNGIKNIAFDIDDDLLDLVKRAFHGKNVWICDDLVASGTTMINAYHLLKSLGVKTVTGFSLFARNIK